MFKIYSIFTILLLIIFTSCKYENKKSIKDNSSNNSNLEKKIDSSIYVIKSKTILFYCPSQSEFDSMTNNLDSYHSYLLNEELADFVEICIHMENKEIKEFLFKYNIKHICLDDKHKKFKIKMGNNYTVFEKDSHKYGVIISDGIKKPLIISDTIINIERLKQLIKSYFLNTK